ncbi:NAD(P)H-hydrate dehydratase [Croceibacterium mercuriale]|uniref:NAD(P)H-hydrate dehydratase n=1 Tax=Croceibacterium mercuriale TaxID=1572751 RepID=UPI0022856563|nr:NAD(P)H-hydrate dehydratase [Croceibacterium mercuriale]
MTAAQMRAAEDVLIAAGTSVSALMEHAGRGAAEWVWRVAAGRTVTVLCGPGNNGGDGYVIARVLAERGLPVQVVAPLPPATEAAQQACRRWGGVPVADAAGAVLVDCLFGTGLTRALSPELSQMLQRLAAAHPFRIAIDLPSGIDSDTGQALGDGMPDYQLTVALGGWKRAHWLMPAGASMGERRLVEIGIDAVSGAGRLARRPELTAPRPDAHKYSRGLLAVVGGAMPGASLLAARAAMRGGAGYVRLLAAERPEGVPDDLVVLTGPAADALADERIAAVLAGSGLERGTDAAERLRTALASDHPLVLDADALHLLTPAALQGRDAPLALTPHAGEMAALCRAFAVVAEGKIAQAQGLAAAANAVVIAKGADTIIAGPAGELVFTKPATSWLSVAGTGDVLAGLVASRLANGSAPLAAAEEGLWLHATAARLAGSALLPDTLIAALPAAWEQAA